MMKKWGEGKATAMAVVVSAGGLLGAFGFAAIMRNAGQRVAVAPFAATASATTFTETTTADPLNGRHLFLLNCAHCHGDDARGDEGPNLHDLHKSDGRIREVITAGIKGEMPSFGKKFGDGDIR